MNFRKSKSIKPFIISVTLILIIGFFTNYLLQRHVFYPLKYFDIIAEHANNYKVDPYLVLSLVKAESNFNEKAVSSKGAKGLMQLQESTASWCADKLGLMNYKTENLYEPNLNIQIGTWYLAHLIEYYGEPQLALTAYNAGIGNVDKWLSNKDLSDGVNLNKIPFKETHTYINKINSYYKRYKQLYDNK